MRVINKIVKILTFPSAFLKGFWEQLLCKMMGCPVESKKIFQSGEMAGHIEHEPFPTAAKSFWFCFVTGFMMFLTGLLFAVPAVVNLFYLDASSPILKFFSIIYLYCAFGAFTNMFPSIEDGLMMWEKFKGMKKAGKIILAPAAAIMYIGSFAETNGITFATNCLLAAAMLVL